MCPLTVSCIVHIFSHKQQHLTMLSRRHPEVKDSPRTDVNQQPEVNQSLPWLETEKVYSLQHWRCADCSARPLALVCMCVLIRPMLDVVLTRVSTSCMAVFSAIGTTQRSSHSVDVARDQNMLEGVLMKPQRALKRPWRTRLSFVKTLKRKKMSFHEGLLSMKK